MVIFDFNKYFYNLRGSTFKDRKKNFFKLLQKTSRCATPQQIELSLGNLQPRHYQEELFKIDALIYFRQVRSLLEILKALGRNEIFVRKIIKNQWFFEEAFKTINAETLVNDLLPTFSFSLRMKVLKGLSVSLKEEQIDSIFDCLLGRYGLFIAAKLISSCSADKIEHVFQTNKMKLSPKQQKMLYQKDAKLLVLYLLQHKDATHDNSKLFSYIAQRDPELFCELIGKFIIDVSLGKRTTKRIIDSKKESVVADINQYFNVLKKSEMVRRLRGYFLNIFEAVFTNKYLDSHTFSIEVRKCLKLYPKKRRWDMLCQTITKLYNKDISENLTLIPKEFITIFSETNALRKWAKVNFTETGNNEFLQFFDTKESIPLLKQKINFTSQISDRCTLLKLMVLTCAKNNDLNAFEHVLKYFCFRHRNEPYKVRSNFLYTIRFNINLQELNENHWRCINEQIEIMRIKNELKYYCITDFTENHLIFLYKNNKPTSDSLKQFITDNIDCRFNIDNKLERVILMDISKIFPEISINDEDRLQLVLRLLNEINNFNINNTNNRIYLPDYPIFKKIARPIFQKSKNLKYVEASIILAILCYNWNCPNNILSVYNSGQLIKIVPSIYYNCRLSDFHETLRLIVCRPNRRRIENELLDIYFKKVPPYSDVDIIKYFMINEPDVIVEYFDQILNTRKREIIDFNTIKKLSHLDLDQRAIKYFKSHLPTTDQDFEKICIKAFSILMTPEEFIVHVQDNYLPKSEEINITNKADNYLYQLQCHAVKMLKNIPEPYKALEVVLKFAVGDYLHESLSTLYKVFYLSPEYLLMPCLEILSKRAVAVRKQSLFLACELLAQTKVLHMIKLIPTTETNISCQKHFLSAALKYFQKNPSDDVFNLFINNINFIDKNDKEFLETLTDIQKIPMMYKHMYLENIWQYYENVRKENDISNYLQSLLSVLNKDILSKLNLEFCRKIILKYFLKNILSSIDDFIYNFLAEHDQQQENFDFVFKILTDFKNENLSDKNNPTKARDFYNSFFHNLVNDKNKDLSLKFKQYWELTFTMKDDFASNVLLNLLIFYYDSNQQFSNTFSFAVGNYFEELLTQFGTHATNLFVKPFQDFFDGKDLDMYNVLLDMLNKRQHIELRIISYKILTSRRDTGNKDVISQIEDHLRQNESEIIQILFKYYTLQVK